jgi:hypothetical protein
LINIDALVAGGSEVGSEEVHGEGRRADGKSRVAVDVGKVDVVHGSK